MFSADNAGLIIVWKTTVHDDSQPQECRRWCVQKVRENGLECYCEVEFLICLTV